MTTVIWSGILSYIYEQDWWQLLYGLAPSLIYMDKTGDNSYMVWYPLSHLWTRLVTITIWSGTLSDIYEQDWWQLLYGLVPSLIYMDKTDDNCYMVWYPLSHLWTRLMITVIWSSTLSHTYEQDWWHLFCGLVPSLIFMDKTGDNCVVVWYLLSSLWTRLMTTVIWSGTLYHLYGQDWWQQICGLVPSLTPMNKTGDNRFVVSYPLSIWNGLIIRQSMLSMGIGHIQSRIVQRALFHFLSEQYKYMISYCIVVSQFS